MNKLKELPTTEDLISKKYGAKGTVLREEFDAKSRAWYYAEILKNARKQAGITQQQLERSVSMWLCLRKEKQICSSQPFL